MTPERFHDAVQRLFRSDLGRDVLHELELRYRPEVSENPYTMAAGIGRFEIVMLLKSLTEEPIK
jgi:hypothetical protein